MYVCMSIDLSQYNTKEVVELRRNIIHIEVIDEKSVLFDTQMTCKINPIHAS